MGWTEGERLAIAIILAEKILYSDDRDFIYEQAQMIAMLNMSSRFLGRHIGRFENAIAVYGRKLGIEMIPVRWKGDDMK